MGSSKALLDWHGTPLLRRVVGILQRVADPVVVVHAEGQELPRLPPGVDLRIDASPGRGPLEGIAAGLRALEGRADVAFVSGTDVPLLHPAFVRSVAAAVDGNDAAVPVADGHVHPLASVYRLSLLPAVERLLAEDRLRPAFLFDRARVRRLEGSELPEPDSLRNMNTPEDYRAALAEPLPEISVEAFGPLRRTLGFARTSVRAASLGDVLDALPAVVEHLDHVLVALNGEHFQADREAPLVHGDTLALVTAEAGG